MTYVMGIDGGGSTVRAVVATPDLRVVGQGGSGSANPNSAGHEAAADSIRAAVGGALADAGLAAGDIAAVAAGVAGALSPTVREWLRATLAVLLPNVPLTVTHDLEIALVGAHSERRGILVLAGTGSAIYGDNGWGKTKLAGGWGYLLGDEGGGYWIGLQAMKAVAQSADDESPNPTVLKQIVFDALGITDARQMVSWLYGQPRIKEVAALAPLVLAAEGDRAADSIITLGAMRLAIATRAVKKQLGWHVGMPLSFAGGILMTKNALSRALCVYLYLPEIPLPKNSPVIGAVILALDSIGLKPNAD